MVQQGSAFTGANTYTVHTGTDIYAVFGNIAVTTSQGISYSVTRQKAPVYTMGSTDPRSVARSKRGIAGSMIMTTFDRHSMSEYMTNSTFYAKTGSMETTQANPHETPGSNIPLLSASVQDLTVVGAGVKEVSPMFTDQILPFDTTLSARNEYNSGSSMRVYGLEILNEGSGVSIDDTSNEVQLTYIARLLTPWIREGA